jgi:hypothetical protein
MQRADIGNRVLVGMVAAILLTLLLYFLFLPALPQALRTPGSPVTAARVFRMAELAWL